MSLWEVATFTKVSKSTLAAMEGGSRPASTKVLLRYSTLFNLPLSSVFYLAEHIDDKCAPSTEAMMVPIEIGLMLKWR